MDPFGNAIENIFAVSMQFDLTGLDEDIQRLDCRPHFHAIVGRVGIAA